VTWREFGGKTRAKTALEDSRGPGTMSNNDDLPPVDLPPSEEPPMDATVAEGLGKGAGALLWIVLLFTVIIAIAYFSTAYWSGPVPAVGGQ
jgi:hypothetical protein